MIARRIACPPRYPVPCGRNPLALAYGFPVGKLVRYLAPEPAAVGGEVPVDFRYCRQASCAAPGGDPGLTALGPPRDRVHLGGGPARLGRARSGSPTGSTGPACAGSESSAPPDPAEVTAASSIRLSLEDDPALVPLETLPGRDHYLFPPGEEPPWRWSIVSRPSGRPLR